MNLTPSNGLIKYAPLNYFNFTNNLEVNGIYVCLKVVFFIFKIKLKLKLLALLKLNIQQFFRCFEKESFGRYCSALRHLHV